MPKIFLSMLFCLINFFVIPCFAVQVSSTTVTSEPTPSVSVGKEDYKVNKGDTLWGLSEKKYGNPWIWERIWQANKSSIANPNMIYPGQVLIIPEKSIEAEKKPEESVQNSSADKIENKEQKTVETAKPVDSTAQEKQKEESVEQEKEMEVSQVSQQFQPSNEEEVVKQESNSEEKNETKDIKLEQNEVKKDTSTEAISKKFFESPSMIVPLDWKEDGMIIGEKDDKMMISEGDIIYINCGLDKVNPGVKCEVYRRIDKVKDVKDKNKYIGYEVRRIGKIEITEYVSKDTATARVLLSSEPIEKEDIIKILK